jgi:hypothetical protein
VSYLASFRGGSYGTKCTPEMFAAINRKWTTSPHTAVPGLYLAGSDAFLPSVTGAMLCTEAFSVPVPSWVTWAQHVCLMRCSRTWPCACERLIPN